MTNEQLRAALERLDAARADSPPLNGRRDHAADSARWNHYFSNLDRATQAVIDAARELCDGS